MEFLNWKNILLEWANRLNYLGRAHYSLNMVDIEQFYREYQTSVTSKEIASKKLESFISSYFPQFHPSWNEEGKMSPDDYVYGYSLLLYFACVKFPDEKIQKICKDMQAESQLVVRAFLQNLLDSNSFSRETIKGVIECSAPAKLSDYVLVLSPTKISEMNMCPPTPKSKILNEWNVENRQLKAQVETERFEKGFLETQLKRKEEEVNDLHLERRKFLAEIQQLKSQLTEKDTENVPANFNNGQSESLKRRLRKEISDKEVEINNLQNRMDELTTSKLHFSEKLTLVESQYNASIECSAKLANKLEELTETCDKQQEHIKGLEINIKEYQKYFNESNSKGSSLETSSDNLEDSFALAMASMPEQSMSSPENLGKMVDMQLREQMALYESLRDKFNGIETENQQLKEQIEEHIRRTAALELKCRQVMDENTAKAQQNEEKCQQFAVLTKESELNVAKLQSLRTEFDSLTLKVNDNHRTIENLNDTKASLQQQLNVREDEVTELNTQLETANAELIAAETKRSELASQHREILSQKDAKLTEAETEKSRLCDQINDLKSSVSSAQELNVKLQTENGELVLAMEKAETMRSEMSSQHQEILSQKDAKLTEAETEKCSLCDQVNDLKSSVSSAQEINAKLRTENGDLVLAMEKAETMRSEMSSQHQEILSQKDAKLTEAETEKCSLCDQVNDLKSSVSSAQEINAKLRTENGDLVLAMEKAETMRSEMSSQHQEILSQKDAKLTEAETEKSSLCDQVDDLKSSVSSAQEINAKLRTENGELSLALKKAETMRSEMSSQHQEILSQKDAKLTEAETEKSSLCDQVNDLKSSVSRTEELNVKLRTENGELALAMEEVERIRSELASQLEEIQSRKDAMLVESEADMSSLRDQVEKLKSSLSSAEETHVALQTRNEELVMAMEKEKKELRETINELTACRKDRDSLQQSSADLTDQIANLTEERQQVDSKLATNEQVLCERDSLRDQLDIVEKSRLELESRLKVLECSRANLEAQLNQSEDEKEKLFLNLQEKIDEAEASELALKEWSQRYDKEVAKYESAVQRNDLVCESYELQVASLTNATTELTECKQNLIQSNNDLRAELSQIRLQLEAMHSEAEQLNNEKKQFSESIEGLTLSKNVNEAEVQQLQTKLQDSNSMYVELKQQCTVLEGENQSLKKSVEEIESKRNALISQLEVAEREVVESREHLHQKDREVIELSKALDVLKSESAASIAERTKIEAELQLNVERVNQLSEELEANKTDLAEKSQLVVTLQDQMETLKASDISMVTKNSELSEGYEALAKKLESVESSRDSLSLQCTSLTEELKAVQDKCNELESDRSTQASARDAEVKSLEMQVDSLKKEIAVVSEVADRKQSELSAKLQTIEEEMATISSRADAKITELQQSVGELTTQNESLQISKAELSSQLSHSKIEFESYQRSTDYKAEIEALVKSKETLSMQVIELTSETKKLAEDLEMARRENASLTDENVDLATEIEKVRSEYSTSDASNRDKINSLKTELNRLETANSVNHQRIDELQKSNETKSHDHDKCAKLEADLKIALTDLEAKMQECRQSEDTRAQLIHDNKILSAKLTQHRKVTADKEEAWQTERTELKDQREKACTEIRFELEGKLNKMKERMKHIYTEETSKSKEKHEKQERELMQYKQQCQLMGEKIEKYINHTQSISEQLYKLNDQNLDLKKDNEFLKSKLRFAESNPRESRLFPPPNFGSNMQLKMEDEDGEVFNNTYLCELKTGVPKTFPVDREGRESIRQSELLQRNSIAARHLRSTYAAQYGDQNLREEDISTPYLNDSMFSNQLDVRRGTLYKRPGPPTPSKNGGRLSFGSSIINASDLFPKDILREPNTNPKTRTTPGKLMSMFSSSKHKETDPRKAITRPIYATFTSTPRRKSNWAREQKSILPNIKLNSKESPDCDQNDAVSTVSTDSLLSKTSSVRRSITRRYSIISKTKQPASLTHKNRSEYRKKNHSRRQMGFEQGREILLTMDDDDGDDHNFGMALRQEMDYLQTDDLFALDLGQSEKFEILTKRTISEHPYSNEPTAIEAIEANESSLTSSAVGQSKTMGNTIMYGKIPKITVNETPQRELICLNKRSASTSFKLMDLTKELFLVLAVIVVCASYFTWNWLSRKNE